MSSPVRTRAAPPRAFPEDVRRFLSAHTRATPPRRASSSSRTFLYGPHADNTCPPRPWFGRRPARPGGAPRFFTIHRIYRPPLHGRDGTRSIAGRFSAFQLHARERAAPVPGLRRAEKTIRLFSAFAYPARRLPGSPSFFFSKKMRSRVTIRPSPAHSPYRAFFIRACRPCGYPGDAGISAKGKGNA